MNSYSNLERFAEIPTRIFNLYRHYGDSDYIGEKVTQLEHAIQCADQAMSEYPSRPEYILGAFFHDIGHMLALDNGRTIKYKFDNKSMDSLGLVNHENIGADFLEKIGCPVSLSNLSRNHVLAKRYLVSTQPEYYDTLSDASKETYWKQGGKLSHDEITQFKSCEEFTVCVKMRTWDDTAKCVDYDYKHDIHFFENMAVKYMSELYSQTNELIETSLFT